MNKINKKSRITVKLIRHSERLDYKHPFYWLICFGQYWSDSPLTQNGHKIAKEKGKNLLTNNFNPKHIYTSPYTRTMATAIEIKSSFPHSEIIIEPLLSEYQPIYKHAINLYPEGIPTTYNGEETNFSYPETYEQFSMRIQFIVDKLLEKHLSDFLIITHGEVLKMFITHLQNKYPDMLLDCGETPYLAVLTFEYNIVEKKIDDKSIRIE